MYEISVNDIGQACAFVQDSCIRIGKLVELTYKMEGDEPQAECVVHANGAESGKQGMVHYHVASAAVRMLPSEPYWFKDTITNLLPALRANDKHADTLLRGIEVLDEERKEQIAKREHNAREPEEVEV